MSKKMSIATPLRIFSITFDLKLKIAKEFLEVKVKLI